MNDILPIAQDWITLLVIIIGLAGVTMETLVKPFIHEIVGKMENSVEFKSSKRYHYLIRGFVFAIACLEAAPFAAELNIFGLLGGNNVPEFVGVALAALAITFGSKQIHDAATFLKALANSRNVQAVEVAPE